MKVLKVWQFSGARYLVIYIGVSDYFFIIQC